MQVGTAQTMTIAARRPEIADLTPWRGWNWSMRAEMAMIGTTGSRDDRNQHQRHQAPVP